MEPLSPEQAGFLLHTVFQPALLNESGITKKVLEAIPVDKGDYRPDPVSKPALELAWHIASAEMRFLEAMAAGQFDLGPRPKPESIRNSAELSKWYSENFQSHMDQLMKTSNDDLIRIVDFRGMFQLPAVMYAGFILHHSVHHRGQLSTYLRPMGAKVPSIYGESHDATQARMAAEKVSVGSPS